MRSSTRQFLLLLVAAAAAVGGLSTTLLGQSDDCGSPTFIAGSPVTLEQNSNNFTTGTAGQGNAACLGFGTRNINNDSWYLWFANSSGVATLSSCGSTVDTKAAVWDGSACPPGIILACNDDSCGVQTQLSFVVVAGSAYLIQLGIFPGATPGLATWTLTGPATPVGTDACAGSTMISGDSGTVAISTVGAGNTPADVAAGACGASASSPDIWYTYVASNCGVSTFSFCPAELGSATYDTVLEAYTDCLSNGGARIICNDDSCGLMSSISFPTAAGVSYKIRVSGFGGDSGQGTMGWRLLPSAFLNGTDGCASGTAITGSGSLFTGNIFTFNAPGDLPAGSCFAASSDRWFTYTAAATGNATFSFCGADRGCASYDSVLAAYSGCGGTQIVCNDDSCGLSSSIVVPVRVGSSYKIRLAGFSNQTGTGVLGWTAPLAPSNNNCASATPVSTGTFSFTTIGATNDFAGTCGFSATSPDVWFSYTASCTGIATVSTCGLAPFDTVLAAMNACGGPEIVCIDDSCGLQTTITFPTIVGQQYLVRIAGFGSDTGSGQIQFSCASTCQADFNLDGNLDPDDLADYISAFFSQPPAQAADFNQDGIVDPDDLADYITAFFQGC